MLLLSRRKSASVPNVGRRSGAPNMFLPHIWWLIQAVKRGVDCNERCIYAELIIHCTDCSVAESYYLPIRLGFFKGNCWLERKKIEQI
jgi:hypothetical protein